MQMALNVGVYGIPEMKNFDYLKVNRALEKVVASTNGRKGLYAHVYYTKEEFWKIYNQSDYQKIRKKYCAENAFMDLYEKLTKTKK